MSSAEGNVQSESGLRVVESAGESPLNAKCTVNYRTGSGSDLAVSVLLN